MGFLCGSAGKESACSVGDLGSIPGLGRSPGEGNGYPLQYSGLRIPWRVHGVTKSRTRLSAFHYILHHCCCCCCWVASVVSDSVQPHRRQPTRLPSPCDPPGKNTGVGCHFLLQCMKVKSGSELAQSGLTLPNPMDCSPPGSSVHGIFQARVLEWVAIAFSDYITIYIYIILFL